MFNVCQSSNRQHILVLWLVGASLRNLVTPVSCHGVKTISLLCPGGNLLQIIVATHIDPGCFHDFERLVKLGAYLAKTWLQKSLHHSY